MKPHWMRKRLVFSAGAENTARIAAKYGIHTVCHEAACPNINECFSSGTCTFIILGNICTRNCGFCNVRSGTPDEVDRSEPERIAESVAELHLRHAVITMVTRDDLDDGGASVCAETVRQIRKISPGTGVELLISDLNGNLAAADIIIESQPDIIAHNVEAVRDKYSVCGRNGDYDRSMRLLSYIHSRSEKIVLKSGIMAGFGESMHEIREVLSDLKTAGCSIFTAGQYCSPGPGYAPVVEYVTPDMFDMIREEAFNTGFSAVESGPFVRSSYLAGKTADTFRNSLL